ncbi:MAG TPA: asparagine synthase (glutamine-hydrolyzing), partial [Actinomycetota bacterium]|nr:asparagine synthase (glutamine-hydrolyzing) [Actinomycetota bacterium]
MCGICGFAGPGDAAVLDRMMRRLEHRGPDEEGRHLEPGITLGARRLRVIDPAGGHQPITNETGTIWVVMNGEIYNYRELRDELIKKGHRFVSNCDTEVLVHLYEQEGENGVHRLRGMFAYALWDRERQTLLLVRDRLGIKPLYYTVRAGRPEGERRVVFASELPALLAACPPPALRPAALAQYLTLLYVPGPGTVFEDVQQLHPGELLKIVNGKIETRRYFRPEQSLTRRSSLDATDAPTPFLDLLFETVRAHLVSDVPLGLLLSGGLDSGAILAMMRRATNGSIRTFTIGYEAHADRSYNELDAARVLARHFGTEHTEERLRPDAVKLLPRIVASMGEPFADSSAIPTYLVSEVARRSVTVALSGIGGDELFGGYPRYLGIRAAARYARAPETLRAWVATHLASKLPEGDGSRNQIGRLKRFLSDGHRSLSEQYVRWISFLPPEWGTSAFTPEWLAQVGPLATSDEYRSAFTRWPSEDPADRAMGLDLQT